ncbi:MAG: hypothetical protein WDN48_00355 [Pseudolabrys sp.]
MRIVMSPFRPPRNTSSRIWTLSTIPLGHFASAETKELNAKQGNR